MTEAVRHIRFFCTYFESGANFFCKEWHRRRRFWSPPSCCCWPSWPQIQVNPRAWDSTFSPSISDASDDFSQNVSSILPEVYFQKFFRNLWQFEIHNFLYVKCMEMRLSRYSYALLFAFGMAYQCHKPWQATVSHAIKNAASDTKYFYAHSTRY